MRSWAQIVKATAHIPIAPPPLVPKKAVLRLGGTQSTLSKRKKQSKKKKKETQEVCFETLTDEKLIAGDEDYEMPWEDDPYEKQEREARKTAAFLHSIGDYKGVYSIATKYYFC